MAFKCGGRRMKKLKIFTKNIEQEAINQINLLLNQETFKDSKIRIRQVNNVNN